MLRGVQLLVDVGRASTSSPLSTTRRRVPAFPGEGELEKERVSRNRLLAGRVVPTEREPGRPFHDLDNDRAAPFTEAQVVMSAGLDLQLDLVGEPLAHLLMLSDRPPRHLDGGP